MIDQGEKTIVFCATQIHALAVRDLINQMKTSKEPEPPEPPVGEPRAKVKVKLADGKERTLDHMVATSFWSPDGKPISAQQFLHDLYGALPDFFKDEAELRALWSAPDTRKAFLDGLAEKGYGRAQILELQRIIDAEKSDLFDVLAYVAFALQPITREERAQRAKIIMSDHFNTKQRMFLDFVLSQYVRVGVDELAQEKLAPLLKLKYHNSISDAIHDLGEDVDQAFVGFQKYLYQEVA